MATLALLFLSSCGAKTGVLIVSEDGGVDGSSHTPPCQGHSTIALDGTPESVAADHLGGIIISGEFSGTFELSGQTLEASGFSDVFLASTTSDGSARWLASVSSPERDITGELDVHDGEVWAVAYENFGDAIGVLLHFDVSGELILERRFNGVSLSGVAVTDAHVFITGSSGNGGDLLGISDASLFVLAMDHDGQDQWIRSLDQCDGELPCGNQGAFVESSPDGAVIWTGTVTGDLELFDERAEANAFLIVFESDGTIRFAHLFRNAPALTSRASSRPETGHIGVAGFFNGTMVIDTTEIEDRSTYGQGSPFALLFEPSGQFHWAVVTDSHGHTGRFVWDQNGDAWIIDNRRYGGEVQLFKYLWADGVLTPGQTIFGSGDITLFDARADHGCLYLAVQSTGPMQFEDLSFEANGFSNRRVVVLDPDLF